MPMVDVSVTIGLMNASRHQEDCDTCRAEAYAENAFRCSWSPMDAFVVGQVEDESFRQKVLDVCTSGIPIHMGFLPASGAPRVLVVKLRESDMHGRSWEVPNGSTLPHYILKNLPSRDASPRWAKLALRHIMWNRTEHETWGSYVNFTNILSKVSEFKLFEFGGREWTIVPNGGRSKAIIYEYVRPANGWPLPPQGLPHGVTAQQWQDYCDRRKCPSCSKNFQLPGGEQGAGVGGPGVRRAICGRHIAAGLCEECCMYNGPIGGFFCYGHQLVHHLDERAPCNNCSGCREQDESSTRLFRSHDGFTGPTANTPPALCHCVSCRNCGDMSEHVCEHCGRCGGCRCRCGQSWDFRSAKGITFHHGRNHLVTGSRFISVEIEVAGVDGMKPGGEKKLMAAVEKWNAAIVSDGSIPSGGFEINTAPASGDDFVKQITEIGEALAYHNAKVTDACGLHVHVEARDFNFYDVRRLVLLWRWLEPALYGLVHPSRRGSSFCRPCGPHYAKTIMEGKVPKDVKEKFFEAVYASKPNRSLNRQQLSRQKYNDSRYYALNLHSWMFRGTTENRMHHGTVNTQKMLGWGLLNAHILDFAMAAREKDILGFFKPQAGQSEPTREQSQAILLKTLEGNKSLSTWVASRMEVMNPIATAGRSRTCDP